MDDLARLWRMIDASRTVAGREAEGEVEELLERAAVLVMRMMRRRARETRTRKQEKPMSE